MKLHHVLVSFAVAVSSSAVLAGNYGMAGCGLGSILSTKMNWGNNKMQVLAATTNGTSGNQTFGITTGTSNCSESSIEPTKKVKKKAAQQVYLQYNLAHVKSDAAKGQGEYIEGLAGLFGCQNQLTGSYSDFATVSQARHNEIFTSNDAEVVWQNYVNAMQKANLSCHNG